MKKLSMKKTTAAAVTAAVGAALLLGGAGTLAYWTDEAASADQTISSGSLDLGTLDSGDWTVTNGAVVDAAFTGGIVPGDVRHVQPRRARHTVHGAAACGRHCGTYRHRGQPRGSPSPQPSGWLRW